MYRTNTLQSESTTWVNPKNGATEKIEINLERREVEIGGQYRPVREGLRIVYRAYRNGALHGIADSVWRQKGMSGAGVAGLMVNDLQYEFIKAARVRIENNPIWHTQQELAAFFDEFDPDWDDLENASIKLHVSRRR